MDFIQLNDGKSFSRILYSNPVCFLTTVSNSPSYSPKGDINNQPKHSSTKRSPAEENVMVISWLTAINNHGKFIMSINKRRYTCDQLLKTYPFQKDVENVTQTKTLTSSLSNFQPQAFALSVPVAGMEDLVLNVGKTSGKWGSKFPHNYDTNETMVSQDVKQQTIRSIGKKQKRSQQFAGGVPGLEMTELGYISKNKSYNVTHGPNDYHKQNSLFAIKGTVAHLKCMTCSLVGNTIPNPNMIPLENNHQCEIENDHYIFVAQVIDAFVHPNYWDDTKKLFRPLLLTHNDHCRQEQNTNDSSSSNDTGKLSTQQISPPPYLTFLGSQTFAYVTPNLPTNY